MSILSSADLPRFAPKSAKKFATNPDALDGALSLVQALAESDLGAGRSLEITKLEEIQPLNRYNGYQYVLWLSAKPVIENDPNYPFEVFLRFNEIQDFTQDPYFAITNFYLDTNNQLIIGRQAIDGYQRELPATGFTAKVSYYTGFDFDTGSAKVNQLKAAAGALLDHLSSSAYLGISDLKIPFNEFSVKYNVSEPGLIPDSLYQPFRQYRRVRYL